MSDWKGFFTELESFLPVFVSAIPSYMHASLVFSVVMLIGYIITQRSQSRMDLNGDGKESATEKKMRKFIFMGSSVVAALFLSDIAFTISWKLRNRVNRKHLVYSRWFDTLYKTK